MSAEELEGSKSGPALASALEQLELGARSLNGAASAMEQSFGSLAQILARVERGEGTLGRLVNDSSVYHELEDLLAEFRGLAADVRADPKRYIPVADFLTELAYPVLPPGATAAAEGGGEGPCNQPGDLAGGSERDRRAGVRRSRIPPLAGACRSCKSMMYAPSSRRGCGSPQAARVIRVPERILNPENQPW